MLEEEYERSRRHLPRHLRPAPTPERPFTFTIRPVEARDIPHVRELYNHYVTNSVVTLDDEPWSLTRWRDKAARLARLDMPFLVAVSPGGQVLGFALAEPWGAGAASRTQVETSIYLGPGATGKGLGRALLEALVAASEERGIRLLVAIVSDRGAEGSVALHERLGFVEIGRMGRVGVKFGRWIGTIHLEKRLRPGRRRSLRR